MSNINPDFGEPKIGGASKKNESIIFSELILIPVFCLSFQVVFYYRATSATYSTIQQQVTMAEQQLVETCEDLQMRALNRIQLFDSGGGGDQQQHLNRNRWLAHSSRYGICLALGTRARLFALRSADIHRLGQLGGKETAAAQQPPQIRTIHYYSQQVDLRAIAINCDGTALAVAVHTPNSGPFVEIFDVRSFAPGADKQPFPLASIRLSSNPGAQLRDLEWNPAESDLFASITTDNMVATVRCAAVASAIQQTNSVQGGGATGNAVTFTHLQMPSGPLCLSWSPKGKQLVVGDAQGRVHQLKPELTGPPVRQIDPPPLDITTTMERQPSSLACTAICWLSTTEWLVAHQPIGMQQQQQPPPPPMPAPNVSVLVVKKQQPPRWTRFGDVLPTARSGLITFCPMLDWRLVFLYAPDCTQVAVFGQRGGDGDGGCWRRLEFETYDVEMPLGPDGHTNTFPIGAALDFSPTAPMAFGEGPDRIQQVPPPPLLHLLNSTGQLLPYAICSLAVGGVVKEQRPNLTKPPEPIQFADVRFGQPPPGWQPPPQQPIPIVSQQQQQQMVQQMPAMPVTHPHPNVVAEQQQQQQMAAAAAEAEEVSRRRQQQQQATTAELERQQQREAEARAQLQQQQQQQEKQQQKANLERRIEALELALGRSITDYTRVRNAQAQRVQQQLQRLRYEVESRASVTELAHFDQLAGVRNELLGMLRQKSRQLLDAHSQGIQRSAQTLNQLKQSHREWTTEQQQKQQREKKSSSAVGKGEGEVNKQQEWKQQSSNRKQQIAATAPAASFDIQKRLELLAEHYDKSLTRFEQLKRQLASLDQQLGVQRGSTTFAGDICGFYDSGEEQQPIMEPLEQRKLHQTNDNITKMCAKLASRLGQIQRQLELLQRSNNKEKTTTSTTTKLGTTECTPKGPMPRGRVPAAKTAAAFEANRSRRDDSSADFCVLELEQLCLQTQPEEEDASTAAATKASLTAVFGSNQQQQQLLQQNLYNLLAMNQMAALKSAAPAAPATAIRRIQPLRPTATAAALQQTPKEEAQFGGSAANDAEQRLAQRIDDLCRRTPPKPQRVSIGVQSPNFMMEQQQQADKVTPKAVKTKPLAPPPKPPITLPVSSSSFAFNKNVSAAITSSASTLPSFSPTVPKEKTEAAEGQQKPASFMFKPPEQQPQQQQPQTVAVNSDRLPTLLPFGASGNSKLPQWMAADQQQEGEQQPEATATPSAAAAAVTPPAAIAIATGAAAGTKPSSMAPQPTIAPNKTTTLPPAVLPISAAPISTGTTAPLAASVAAADEGMEDEMAGGGGTSATTTTSSSSAVNFDFMKGLGLGGASPSATAAASNANAGMRSAFGSITPSAQAAGSSSLFGGGSRLSSGGPSTAFGTPFGSNTVGSSIFGSPSSTGGGSSGGAASAFGSFGKAATAAASPPSTGSAFGTSAFGASPFGSAGLGLTTSPAAAASGGASGAVPAFGSGPTFGGGGSPFASSSKPFGGASATAPASGGNSSGGGAGGGGGSMFGGGLASGGGATGFSAFASKSSAFGALANQAQQQSGGGGGGSLFGGGMAAAAATPSAGSSGFGGGIGGSSPASGGSTSFGLQKSSAFTAFRK